MSNDDNDTTEVGNEKTRNNNVKEYPKAPAVLDPEEKEDDRGLEKADRGKEKKHGIEAPHVADGDLLFLQIFHVSPITMLDLDGLSCHAYNRKGCREKYGVIIPTKDPEFESNEQTSAGSNNNEYRENTSDNHQCRTNVLIWRYRVDISSRCRSHVDQIAYFG